MKNVIFAILTTILFFSCATTKKKESNTEIKKTHVSDAEKKKDSSTVIEKTSPTENGMEFSLKDLAAMMGDFVQKVNSGNGNESTIEKRGDKLIVTNKNSGSEKKETNVNESKKLIVYDSEFITKEISKTIEKMPLKFWIIFWILIVILFRKFISQILIAFFPVLGTKKIFQLFVGNS